MKQISTVMLNELGTKLGDLNAYLADAATNDRPEAVKEDIEKAYEISDNLYARFVEYDKKK